MVNRIRKELTERQGGVLKTIEGFVLEHGYAPTVRELAKLLGIPNPSAAFKHMTSLEKKGYLRREGGELRLAGLPTESFDVSGGEAMDIPAWMVGKKRGNVFLIRVAGKSMIDACIDDGDHVLLERTDAVNSGEMVVALLEDGSVTLKRLRKDDGKVFLMPENPAFSPIEVTGGGKVLGRVIGVLRKY
jgi:repressor LexA